MRVELLCVHHLEFLSLKRGFTGSSESTLVKMPHCWKSRVMAQLFYFICMFTNVGEIETQESDSNLCQALQTWGIFALILVFLF